MAVEARSVADGSSAVGKIKHNGAQLPADSALHDPAVQPADSAGATTEVAHDLHTGTLAVSAEGSYSLA